LKERAKQACREAGIGIQVCIGKKGVSLLEKSKRSVRQKAPDGRRDGFPRGFRSETDPAGFEKNAPAALDNGGDMVGLL